ncbi:thioredoxin family protein [Pseudoxanthobacter sp. M-2]|uniref:thioredoxin family protein n=1 Tax=Pseudoxanthobacter sp. M-2 TaxID=3078754 RepID=UPI0038FCB2E8
MISRRSILVAVVLAALPLRARAGVSTPFSPAAFERAQAEGRTILVHVTAPWCGTCRAQKRVLPEILASQDFSEILWLDVDFDSQADVRKALDARHQSTMVLFKGSREIARAVGETDPTAIRAFLLHAL